MFRWCSFCQTYQGEIEPFCNFDVTHGICSACKQNRSIAPGIPPVVQFFNALRDEIRKGRTPYWKQLLERSSALKVTPIDLLQGVLQPLLYEIGALYEAKQLTVYQEHLFTSNVLKLLHELESKYESQWSEPGPLDVLLVCIDGNYHDLGTHVVNLWCLSEGFRSRTLGPSLPHASITEAVKAMKPKILGISVCESKNLSEAESIISQLKSSKLVPAIAIGGLALKGHDEIAAADFTFTGKRPKDFLDFVSQHCGASKKKAA